MKIRKILAALVACAMLFSTLCFTVSATDGNVAKVGDTEYATMEEALANWKHNTVLTLLGNATLPDVVQLDSTQHHILNLGTYTLTAAEKKNAFEIMARGTGSSEQYSITINADADNPGTLDAGNKSCIYYNYSKGTATGEDRPIIKINGGKFIGSTASLWGDTGIHSVGTAARKCATLNISGGEFFCSIKGVTKSKLLISGGVFHYPVGSQGDSTALRLISGGKFKSMGFMTADSNNTKFWYGTSMANSDVGVYVDENDYIVVGGPVITDNTDKKFGAAINSISGKNGNYLEYSSVATGDFYYESADLALGDAKNATSIALYENANTDLKTNEEVTIKLMSNVTYEGDVILNNADAKLYVIAGQNAAFTGSVKAYNGKGIYVYETEVDGVAATVYEQVDDSTPDFAAKVDNAGNVQYFKTFEEAYAAAENGATVTLLADVLYDEVLPQSDRSGEHWNGSYAFDLRVTKEMTLDLNGHTIKSVGGSDSNHYAIICVDGAGDLTITDSSAEKTGAIVNEATSTPAGKMSVVLYSEAGDITLNGGTYTNQAQVDGNYPYVIDSITAGDASLTINEGTKIVADGYTAVRTMSQGGAGTQTVSINGGEIYGGVRAVLKNGAKDVLNFNVTDGEIYPDANGDAISFENYTAPTADADEDAISISGGTFYGSVGIKTDANTVVPETFISGGTFKFDEEPHVSEGFASIPGPGGIFYVVNEKDLVTKVTLSFDEVTTDKEDEKLYNINLTADGKVINRLNSVDLTFALSQVKGGNNAYEIIESNSEIEINNVNNEKDRYEFHFEDKDAGVADTAATITIGQVKVTGYGTYSFGVKEADTNVAHATTLHDNIVDTFVPGGKLADGTEVGTFDVSNGTGEVTIEAPTKDLTVNIAFPNAVNDNVIAYQDMKVVISGDDLAPVTIDLGEDAKKTAIEVADRTEAAYFADFVDGAYVVTVTDALTVNTSYDITVSGAGYRTARYTVRMTDNKTVNFWNNVKDAEAAVEDGKFYQTKNYLAGDIVKDNKINTYDLSAVVSYFGETGLSATNNKAYAKYDLNRDGFIDSKDVAIVLVSWGN